MKVPSGAGTTQAGLLANEILEERLNKRGYRQSKLVPGIWTHDWRPVQFTLVVDDFGVKYVGDEHTIHLRNTIEVYCVHLAQVFNSKIVDNKSEL